MRIDLGKLSLADLLVDLAREGHLRDRVSVRTGDGVSGTMKQSAEGMELKGVVAERLLLDVLLLTFGTFTLDAQGATAFQRLQAELATRAGDLNGRVVSERTSAVKLAISVGELNISGELDAEQLELDLQGAAGEVRASKATFRGLLVKRGALQIACAALDVDALKIGWGNPAFALSCAKAVTAELELTGAGSKVRAKDIALSGVDVNDGDVVAASLRLARVEADVTFVQSNKKAVEPALKKEAAGKLPLYDERLLDGLSGRIKADVEVGFAVPIIGSRHALHELRLAVESGAIDYLKLEGGLSRLEDALLNFAVRDAGLALELGFPLVGRRGHGKPLVVWDLSPEDLRLAELNRVRLAVLARPRAARSPEPSEPPKAQVDEDKDEANSRFALRELSVGNIDTELSLSPQPASMTASVEQISFGKVHVQGTVHHDVEARGLTDDEGKQPNRDGSLRVEAENVALKLREFAMEAHELSIAAKLGRVEGLALRFEDTHLAQVTGVVTDLAFDGVKFELASAES